MSDAKKLEVGTRLYLGPDKYRHRAGYVTVSMLGRKWAALSNGTRFDHTVTPWTTDDNDGIWPVQPVWWSHEEAERDRLLNRSIEVLTSMIQWGHGHDLRKTITSVEQVRLACELLGLLQQFDDAMKEKP